MVEGTFSQCSLATTKKPRRGARVCIDWKRVGGREREGDHSYGLPPPALYSRAPFEWLKAPFPFPSYRDQFQEREGESVSAVCRRCDSNDKPWMGRRRGSSSPPPSRKKKEEKNPPLTLLALILSFQHLRRRRRGLFFVLSRPPPPPLSRSALISPRALV